MGWKLEAVSIPASDVDRAKTFCAEKVGSNVDLDVNADGDPRVFHFCMTRGSRLCSKATSSV